MNLVFLLFLVDVFICSYSEILQFTIIQYTCIFSTSQAQHINRYVNLISSTVIDNPTA